MLSPRRLSRDKVSMPLREDKGGESPQVLSLMKNLGITEEEALDIIECDKRIDKGEKLFELTEDQKKAVRKVSQTRSVDAYGKTRTREKKEDQEKNRIKDTQHRSIPTQISGPTTEHAAQHFLFRVTIQLMFVHFFLQTL